MGPLNPLYLLSTQIQKEEDKKEDLGSVSAYSDEILMNDVTG